MDTRSLKNPICGESAEKSVQQRKSLAPSQLRQWEDEVDESTTTMIASVPTTLSCNILAKDSSGGAVSKEKDNAAATAIPVKSGSFILPCSRANNLKEAVKKPQRPPPPNLSMISLSSKTNKLSRSMNAVASSSNKPDTTSRSCSSSSKVSLSVSENSSAELSKQKPRPTLSPARQNPPKRLISKTPNTLHGSSGEKLSSATALQLTCSSKEGLEGSQSSLKSVQNNQFTIINSREKHFERKQSKYSGTGHKAKVCSSTPRSFRPLHQVKENFTTTKDKTATSSVLSKAHSLLRKVKAVTLAKSGTSSTQLKLAPSEKTPRPVSPPSSIPVYETIEDPPQHDLGDVYSYVDVSSRWNGRSHRWSELMLKSKYVIVCGGEIFSNFGDIFMLIEHPVSCFLRPDILIIMILCLH